MADVRDCAQCGAGFRPRREHARFCSARCRVAWNREHVDSGRPEATALDWSLAAMDDVTERLRRARAADKQHAFALISEAVWWVTIVDGTLVRYHHEVYDGALARQSRAERVLVEGSLAGLRFVRNRMGYDTDQADFIELRNGRAAVKGARVTAWTWKSLPEPHLGTLPPRGQDWELTRYHAYQDRLAGSTIGETFRRAAAFLNLVAAKAQPLAEVSEQATS